VEMKERTKPNERSSLPNEIRNRMKLEIQTKVTSSSLFEGANDLYYSVLNNDS